MVKYSQICSILCVVAWLTIASSSYAEPDGWSNTESVVRREGVVVSYRARLDDDLLLVEVTHAQGWHTYAMDNTERARRKSGKDHPDTELPTRIEVTGGLEIAGRWKQSDPKDLSQEEIEWYTWGFDGTAHFAVKVRRTGDELTRVRIRAQACNATSCSMVDGLILELPEISTGSQADDARRVFRESLENEPMSEILEDTP